MLKPTFAPGFQLSVLDVVVLVLAVIGTYVLGRYSWWAGLIILFVVGHFFLFCNVFRIARKSELIWAGTFEVLTAATILWEIPGWIITISSSLLLTMFLVVLEMRKPSYHGIFWQCLNPGLLEYWNAKQESETPDNVDDPVTPLPNSQSHD